MGIPQLLFVFKGWAECGLGIVNFAEIYHQEALQLLKMSKILKMPFIYIYIYILIKCES